MTGHNAPPAYLPPNNYGHMSPTANKHMSMTSSAPVTDAFGNPQPTSFIPAPYPGAHYSQGYAPQHMQSSPMMGQQPQWPPPTPSNDIFGSGMPPPQQIHETRPLVSTDAPSMRTSSPSSMNAPAPANGGIEAFLQRQARMSPMPENELQGQQSSP